MTDSSYLESQLAFFAKRLKALRRNEDRTLRFDFQFEEAHKGLFFIRVQNDDDPYYGAFKIFVDSDSAAIRIDMHCSGISRALKVERANQYQYSEHKVILDKRLTPLTSLHQGVALRKRRKAVRINN
jgi:hypothetical protein